MVDWQQDSDEEMSDSPMHRQMTGTKDLVPEKEIDRLRELRNLYRSREKAARKRIAELEAQIARQADKKSATGSNEKRPPASLTLERELPDRMLPNTVPRKRSFRLGGDDANDPAQKPSSTKSREKPKCAYPHVAFFRGNNTDRDMYEGWKIHLEAKFRIDSHLFANEESKISYIKDHCKDSAFDVIQARIHPTSNNPYLTAEEMIGDLDLKFGESDDFDLRLTNELKLRDYNFRMGPEESLEDFVARYTTLVAPLSYGSKEKLDNFRWKLPTRLIDGLAGSYTRDFNQFVSQAHAVDHRLRKMDEQKVGSDE